MRDIVHPVVHLADPMINGLQVCSQCGAILSGYRGSEVPDTDTRSLTGWKVGAHVEVTLYGGARFSDLVDKPATCGEMKALQ